MKATHAISYAFAVATAARFDASGFPGDRKFEPLEELVEVEWIQATRTVSPRDSFPRMSDPTSDSNAAVEGRHRVERVLGEGAADPPRCAAAQICRLVNGRAEQAPEVEGVA